MATASTPGATENVVHDPITHSPLALRDWSMSPTASRTSSQESMTLRGSEESVAAASTDFDDVRAEWDANARKSKIQLAGVAGAASFLGATAVLALSSILRRFLSGWLGLVLSGVLCIVIAAVCAGSVVHYYEPAQPPIQLEGKETQLHKDKASDNSPETALWFNTFLASLWPIVNPALFISIADMLEDELAATLPKFITGVRVADIGQGSQSIEIANISSLDVDESKHDEDSGQVVNLEVLVAYREHSHGKALKERSGNPHILMEFVLTGGVPVPVWIELTGLKVGARMRIGLMPNPPFLSSLVLTLLGKPKVTLKCTPLTQHFVNIMDIPVLSGWMQSAIDSAVAAYVAPHSLSMDLKTLLSGAEPMDTEAHGVVVVIAKYAVDFKDGDAGKFWESQDERHGDPYVSIGWGKWGKPIWSSRIIANEGKPYWEEIAFLLVGPSEMNAKERLRLQLWDSDRGAADDLLGSVEVNLHEIMEDSKTLNKMTTRTDPFTDVEGSQELPGKLTWECGYFAKTTLEQHLEHEGENMDQLNAEVEHQAERELREADTLQSNNGKEKMENEKKAKLKDRGIEIIAGAPPTDQWPSGILWVQIQQIDGLVVPHPRKSKIGEGESEDAGGDLPSAYCTIILNHQRVYRTRTKLKTNKPFFAAGTERFVKDWRTTTAIIAVRDHRLHEMDPLIGVVVLPLRTILEKRCQVAGSYPLVGGIGFGRVQISLVFRSVQAQLPRPLTGWELTTLEVQPHARTTPDSHLPSDIAACRLVFRTLNGKGKLYANSDGDGSGWSQSRDKPLRLAVKRRFGESLVVEFRKHSVTLDSTPAFCVLWLKDVIDDEETTIKLPIWRNTGNALARARFNAEEPQDTERLGSLEVTMKMWPGLSGYHKPLADTDESIADVMKVLDAAEETMRGDEDPTHDSLYDAEKDSDSEAEEQAPEEKATQSNGLVGEIKDYKKRAEQLHSHHRGLMQWGAMRKMAWMGHNVEEAATGLQQKVKGKFHHQQAEQGMDIEA